MEAGEQMQREIHQSVHHPREHCNSDNKHHHKTRHCRQRLFLHTGQCLQQAYCKTYQGRRLNEDTFTVQIIDDKERLLTFTKADLREYEVVKTSPMPPATSLSDEELADLIGYLLTLKGTP